MNFSSESTIETFQLYLSLFIFSKLGSVQSKVLPVRNIGSTQLIVKNIKIRPFLRDAMYNVSKFHRKEKFYVDWSKQCLSSLKTAYK